MKLTFLTDTLQTTGGLVITQYSTVEATMWAQGASSTVTLKIALEGTGRTYLSKPDWPELRCYNAGYTAIRWRSP